MIVDNKKKQFFYCSYYTLIRKILPLCYYDDKISSQKNMTIFKFNWELYDIGCEDMDDDNNI